jgi:hypothetical protein
MNRAGEFAAEVRLALPSTPYCLARSKSRNAPASVASDRYILIQPLLRISSGTPASAISASCSIRLRRINGITAMAARYARSGAEAR